MWAPRVAGDDVREVREQLGLSLTQFAQQLQGETSSRTPLDQSVTSHALGRWEAGLARVPLEVHKQVKLLGASTSVGEPADAEEIVMVKQSYPRQESMVGPEYQTVIPKSVSTASRTASGSKTARRDERMFSPRLAAREGVVVGAYLTQVQTLLADEETLAYDEEVALYTLHQLNYSVQLALDSLALCVAWRRREAPKLEALLASRHTRAACAYSVLWQQRLRTAKRRRSWTAGESEALHAGLLAHGKDLAGIWQSTLRDKAMAEVVELYYRSDAWASLAKKKGPLERGLDRPSRLL